MKNLVITGDSISYNRYGYDENVCVNGFDCKMGMGSWSFRLLKKFITGSIGFKYGNEVEFSGETMYGMGEGIDDSFALFGKKVVTIKPENNVIRFTFESETGEITIYFQNRRNNYCRFNIYVDGNLEKEAVDTYGTISDYQYYGLKTVKLCVDNGRKFHEIILTDFEYTELEPFVTIAGISAEGRGGYLTGQGGRTAKFLLYHLEDRVLKYSPDILVFTLGANDCAKYSCAEFKKYISDVLERVLKKCPDCKIFAVSVPPMAKISDEVLGVQINSDEDLDIYVREYNNILREAMAEFGGTYIDCDKIFGGLSPEIWRFDNVHLSNKGNDMLFDEISEFI